MNRHYGTGSWGGVSGPIGVVAEVAPGQFVTMKLHGHMSVEFTTDAEAVVSDEYLTRHVVTSRTAHIVIDGSVSDWTPTTRPEWATEPAGEITAPPKAVEA